MSGVYMFCSAKELSRMHLVSFGAFHRPASSHASADPHVAFDSGNCISWLSRALRTFARTLTMDSHAGPVMVHGARRSCVLDAPG